MVTIIVGFTIGKFIGPPINQFMTWFGELINWSTEQQPLIMGILVAVLMGWALTAPISSVAIAFMLGIDGRSEEHTSELQSRFDLVCRLLLEKKKQNNTR